MIIEIISGILLSLANAIAAILVIKWAYKKKRYGDFNKIVLSSLVIRYVCMILLVGTGLLVFEDHRLAFAMTVVSASFLMLMGEILYIHFKSNSLNLQNRMTK